MHPADLKIEDYTYTLPDERIARYPLLQRDASKLLVYKKGMISEGVFSQLPDELPSGSLIVFNQTKVVHARLLFRKPTGGAIEVFCLEPHEQYGGVSIAMTQQGKVWWRCMVGGAAKWKEGIMLEAAHPHFKLTAKIIERAATDFIIELEWDNPDLSFAEVLREAGDLPLPPYLNRTAEAQDEVGYQTIFAAEEGSVAAPTASLHFTPAVMEGLIAKGIQSTLLTLHVGAGTFKPVKAETIGAHQMHAEWMEVSRTVIEDLLAHPAKKIIAAGTTTLRTLESLYWIGCKIIAQPDVTANALEINQWEPYRHDLNVPATVALRALQDWLLRTGSDRIITKTGILIAPGYDFKIVSGLITNFHQPQSTLLLLVAALIGEDWRRVYDYALAHRFRFLSFGDSSLLWRQPGF